jgi:hypothetical protein
MNSSLIHFGMNNNSGVLIIEIQSTLGSNVIEMRWEVTETVVNSEIELIVSFGTYPVEKNGSSNHDLLSFLSKL